MEVQAGLEVGAEAEKTEGAYWLALDGLLWMACSACLFFYTVQTICYINQLPSQSGLEANLMEILSQLKFPPPR